MPRFTGNPRVATYKEKGLDYFLQAPRLKAQAKASALNMVRESDLGPLTGLIPEDAQKIRKMGEYVEGERQGALDHLLDGGEVSDNFIKGVARTYSNSTELGKKVQDATFNAQKKAKIDQQFDQAAMQHPEMRDYYNRAKTASNDEFMSKGGTFAKDGNVNQFNVSANVPDYVDIKKELNGSLKIAMANMEEQAPGSTAELNIRVVPETLPDGRTVSILTYDKPTNTTDNSSAIDAVIHNFNTSIYNEDGSPNTQTSMGRMAGFMGKDYTDGIISEVPGIAAGYERTKKTVDQTKVVQNLGITAAPLTRDQVLATRPGVRKNDGSFQIDPSYVMYNQKGMAVPHLEDMALVNPDGQKNVRNTTGYNEAVKGAEMKMFGAELSVADVQGIVSTNISGRPETQAFNNNQLFGQYLRNGSQDPARVRQYKSMSLDIGKLTKLGETYDLSGGLAVTAKETNAMGGKAKVARELKENILDYMTDEYTEYMTTSQRGHTGFNRIDFQEIPPGSKVQKPGYRKIANRIAAEDVRIMQFDVNDATNGLDLTYDDSVDKGQGRKEDIPGSALHGEFTQRLNEPIGSVKGFQSEPALVTRFNMHSLMPEKFKGKTEAEIAQLERSMNGAFMYTHMELDDNDNPHMVKTFVENRGHIPSPANEPAIINGAPGIMGEAIDELPIGGSFEIQGKEGTFVVERTTGENYMVKVPNAAPNALRKPYADKSKLINALYNNI
tara:strand:- start:34530 stop:36704 length:2175 start_codon:yes stop_codon:yes gene_type:complete